jgi:hypothetical protein
MQLSIKNKKFLSGVLRLFILTWLVMYAYWPFAKDLGLNIGGSDARFYQYILHDAIAQLNHGIFPTYVGQSEYTFFGGPVIRAPYYLLLGQFINGLTFNHLSALCIQHLTVLFSALAAAFLTYMLLINSLSSNKEISYRSNSKQTLRWFAAALAFFYVSCPGVMALIYRYDMYYSFMTIPFVPIVIFGLIRTQQKNDLTGPILTAMGLSLIWFAHPPIALWVTFICFLFYGLRFLFLRKGFKGLLIFSGFFLLLSCWQFVSIFSMGIEQGYGAGKLTTQMLFSVFHTNTDYSNNMVIELKSAFPGILLPLESKTQSFLSFFQLGYSLWLTVLAATLVSIYSKNCFTLRSLLGCILFLLLILYPLPFIGDFIWSHMPPIIAVLTDSCPMQRFYVILAAITTFAGILTFNSFHSKKSLYALYGILIALTGWSLNQTTYFSKGLVGKNNSWATPKNIYFTPGQVSAAPYVGIYDPALKQQILNNKKIPIQHLDNEIFLMNKCFANKNTKHWNLTVSADPKSLPSLAAFNLIPNQQYILCLNAESQSEISMGFRINDELFAGLANANQKNIPIPFFTFPNKNHTSTITFDNVQSAKPVKLIKANIISYTSPELPIQVISYTPYKAFVMTPSNNTYLRIFKRFYPGYEAKVNGTSVSILELENDHTILLPLKERGMNQIELKYVGFPLMKKAFYTTLITWGLALSYLLIVGWRRKSKIILLKTHEMPEGTV